LLAIGVGTAHGIYKGEPHINIERIAEIHKAIGTALVLHGASGLSNKIIEDSISAGIRKINFATELRQAFTLGLKEGLIALPDAMTQSFICPTQ
jgi:tagatose 1,6-diphosphate aldolase GatY/KbaY